MVMVMMGQAEAVGMVVVVVVRVPMRVVVVVPIVMRVIMPMFVGMRVIVVVRMRAPGSIFFVH